jgi:hypothetical protein
MFASVGSTDTDMLPVLMGCCLCGPIGSPIVVLLHLVALNPLKNKKNKKNLVALNI